MESHRAQAAAPTTAAHLSGAADRSSDDALKAYAQRVTGFDEMVDANGRLRSHWQPILQFISGSRPGHCNAISERIQRRIVENGLALDSFSDPERPEQPWKLNLVPFVIAGDEWSQIERGLIQRMRLMEALLADLYGPQEALSSGLLPPSLVFNDPAFLRPVHGIDANAPRLMFMAVDLARDETGGWHVLDTHTETVAGHGYALANRVVLADVCSAPFRDANTRRISTFYQDIASECVRRSGSDDPMIAILGPNPDDETYLGHAYMARYLGYTLLEGNDLRVVGGRVSQKTLAGLQSIDLIIRAVAAAGADPLELDPSRFDGPAGLVQAMRERPATIANALGAAIVENRGIAPYLPSLATHFLGESLLLDDSRRVWLGDPTIREEVLSKIEDYVIRPAFEGPARPGHAMPGQRVSEMLADKRAVFESDLCLNGARYVAERPVRFATAPAWTRDGLRPEPCAIRLFVAAVADGYVVMPGGVALTIKSGSAIALSSQDAESRDVWVQARESQGPHFSRWRISDDASVERLGARLPSRVADNLFWLGRYVERADWTMRMMRNALNRGDDDLRPVRRSAVAENAIDLIESKDTASRGPEARPEARGAATRDGEQTDHPDKTNATDATSQANAPSGSLEDRVAQLLCSATNPYAVRQTLVNIRRLARQSRDRLSLDAWRVLNRLTDARDTPAMADDLPSHLPSHLPALDLTEKLDNRITDLAAYNGFTHENMTRNFAWRFNDLGRRMERAAQAAELLGRLVVTPTGEDGEAEALAFLLETFDSFMTYRARYRFAPTFPLVLDLLMLDETNPRSVAYQLVRISDHLNEMPKASQDAVRTPEQRHALELLTAVRLSDLEALRTVDEIGRRSELEAVIDRLVRGLPELSDIVSRRYFSLTEDQPQRVHMRLVP